MLLSELLERVQTRGAYTDAAVTAVTDKTDCIVPGCVFVCIQGAHFDGHTAAASAMEQGAAAVVVQRDTGAGNQVIVDNTREAYALLCQAYYGYPADKMTMIGVTGTNGKTTTAFLIKDILESRGIQTGLVGTVKNMIGCKEVESRLTTPDPLELNALFAQMVEGGCTHCVMEVSSQALAQGRVKGIHFTVGAFTNLTQDHLDYHGTFEAYRQAKRRLFLQTDTAVLNADDPNAMEMVKGINCKVVTLSAKTDEADYSAKNIILKPHSVTYELVTNRSIGRVKLGIPGGFSVYNSMLAAVCCIALGEPFDEVVRALAHAKGVPGRIEVVPTDTDYTVIIDYAHSPDGLENILTSLRAVSQGRIVTVFGCGGDRDVTKRPLMGEIAARLSDVCVVTSDNPRSEDPDAIIRDVLVGMEGSKTMVIVEADRTRAIAAALREARAGDVVLLAGKGHETYQVLKEGAIHFDERETVQNLLRQAAAQK